MSVNNNSYSTISNIRFGSACLDKLWWNAQTFSVPGISLEPPKHNSRSGGLVNLASDTVHYDDLEIEVILDKEWKTYDSVYAHFVEGLNVETSKFLKEDSFDIWVEFIDGEGVVQKKFWFYKCRLTTIGSIEVSTTDAEDTLNNFNISFVFDYMDNDNHLLRNTDR